MRATILLFDIDGTLIHTRGAGRRAMAAAFQRCCDSRNALTFRFDGMNDRLIMKTALANLQPGLVGPDLDRRIDELIDAYLDELQREAAAAANFSVCPGVEAVVDAARARGDVGVGLGTGNVRRGAAIKLGRVGLFDRFDFGGFGDVHTDRSRILMSGAQQGAEFMHAALTDCRVVVIGDTPRDIEAAHLIGAESIAVATGSFTFDELSGLGAGRVFTTLAEPDVQDALFGRG